MRRILSLSCVVFLSLTLLKLEASSFLELSVSDMTQESRVAYRAKVVSLESFVRDELPFRRVELELLEVFKGRLPEATNLFVEIPGGKIEELELQVSGVPHILEGGEYIFFLDRPADSTQDFKLSTWTLYQVVSDERGQRFVYKAPEEGEQRELQRHQLGFQALDSVQVYEDFVEKIFRSQELH